MVIYWVISPEGLMYESAANWNNIGSALTSDDYKAGKQGRIGFGLCVLAGTIPIIKL